MAPNGMGRAARQRRACHPLGREKFVGKHAALDSRVIDRRLVVRSFAY
jgi:hypothetical protein